MIIVHKKSFVKGFVMALVFAGVLTVMFVPLFGGQNAFQASDKLFNSISKGSTEYIPGLKEKVSQFNGQGLTLSADMVSKEVATNAAKLLVSICDSAAADGVKLDAKCDLGKILDASLDDAQLMFHNRGEEIKSKYGIDERYAMFSWWQTLKTAEKTLTNEERFAHAAFVKEAMARGIEVGYNFYKIEPETVSSKWGVLVFALVFYVVYTLWWGFAIFFLAEGLGLELKAGKKKEA